MVQQEQYFSDADIEVVVSGFLEVTGRHFAGLAADTTKGLRAAYALNSVRILQDRLGMAPETLRSIYTDPEIVPEPIRRFVDAYLADQLPRQRASEILDDLQRDMRQYCFAHHIPVADSSDLAKITMPLLEMVPGYAEHTAALVKSTLRSIVDRYAPGADRETAVGALYTNALDPTNSLNVEALAHGVAELSVPAKYLELMVRIGLRNPAPEELANAYWDALHIFFEEIGIPFPATLDRDKTIEDCLRPEVSQRELERYRTSLSRLSL